MLKLKKRPFISLILFYVITIKVHFFLLKIIKMGAFYNGSQLKWKDLFYSFMLKKFNNHHDCHIIITLVIYGIKRLLWKTISCFVCITNWFNLLLILIFKNNFVIHFKFLFITILPPCNFHFLLNFSYWDSKSHARGFPPTLIT